jgi:hypothetical protein
MKLTFSILVVSSMFLSCTERQEVSAIKRESSTLNRPDEKTAYSVACNFVSARIPDAEIPDTPFSTGVDRNNFSFESYAHKDVYNHNWIVEMKFEGGNWKDTNNWSVNYLSIGEKTFIDHAP